MSDRRNGGHRAVSIDSPMKPAAFLAGFKAAKAGKPYDPEACPAKVLSDGRWSASQQWRYERGRLFAFVWPEPSFKVGRNLRRGTLAAYINAMADGAII